MPISGSKWKYRNVRRRWITQYNRFGYAFIITRTPHRNDRIDNAVRSSSVCAPNVPASLTVRARPFFRVYPPLAYNSLTVTYREGRGNFVILKNHNKKTTGNTDLIISPLYRGTFKVLLFWFSKRHLEVGHSFRLTVLTEILVHFFQQKCAHIVSTNIALDKTKGHWTIVYTDDLR